MHFNYIYCNTLWKVNSFYYGQLNGNSKGAKNNKRQLEQKDILKEKVKITISNQKKVIMKVSIQEKVKMKVSNQKKNNSQLKMVEKIQ